MTEATNIIYGSSSLRLTPGGKSLFRDVLPWGFILFGRNIGNRDQIHSLVDDWKKATNRDDAIVLVDQEGGRASRLCEPEWRTLPVPPVLAALHNQNAALTARAFFLNYHLIAHDLKAIGINVDRALMLDIPVDDASSIVTDRALGHMPEQVSRFWAVICDAFGRGGVAPLIKHAPGHGRALVDSHHKSQQTWFRSPRQTSSRLKPSGMRG